MGDRREDRIPVEILSKFRTGSGRAHMVQVSNLSRSGCMLHQNFSALEPGKKLTLRLGTVGPIESIVRWKDGLDLGIEFEVPLHPSVFEHIVSQNRKED